MFRAVDALPCGSISTTKTFMPARAIAVARLTVVVVFPTPPFWLEMVMMRVSSGFGIRLVLSFSRRRFSDSSCRARGVAAALSGARTVSCETLSRSTKPASITLNLKYSVLCSGTVCKSYNCGGNFQEVVTHRQHFRGIRLVLPQNFLCLVQFCLSATPLKSKQFSVTVQ